MQKDIDAPATPYKDTFLRVVAIIGLIALIILGAWGIIQIVFNLPSLFGSVGDKTQTLFAPASKTESVVVTLPATASSGEPFTISWIHQNSPSGDFAYTISYSCSTGLSLKAPTPTGIFQSVPCATPFDYTNATQNMQVVPTVTTSNSLSAVISVSAISLANGAVTTTGSSTITISPSQNSPAVATPIPTTPLPAQKPAVIKKVTTVARSYSNPNGTPDLAVQIISVIPEGNGLTSVEFAIENLGNKATPYGWTFAANLPVGYAYTYYSQPQRALYPGGRIIYTLTFSGANNNQMPYTSGCYTQGQITYPSYQNCYGYSNPIYATNGTVTITVDPGNLIYETNKANNTASVSVPVTTY